MAVKSVIDVDINDEKVKAFAEQQERIRASAEATNAAWNKLEEILSKTAEQHDKLLAASEAAGKAARENDEAEKERLNRLRQSEKLWTSIGKSSRDISKNVLDIGVGVLKWGALLGGINIGGSLLGLDRLAEAAADHRRSALGLGVSIGEKQAFQTDFARFIDPNAVLSGVNNAVSNVALQGPLYGLGVNPNQETSKVALDTIKAVRALALSTDTSLLGTTLQSRHLDQLGFSLEDLKRLRAASPAEFNQQVAAYGRDVRALGISDATGRGWQTFIQQMERAGRTIEAVLQDKLVKLAGPLGHLSDSVVKAVTRFADGGEIAKGIDSLAGWIDKAANGLAKPEFLDKIGQFTSDLGALADVVHGVADAAQHPGQALGKAVWEDFTEGNKLRWAGLKALFGPTPDPNKAALSAYLTKEEQANGLPAGLLGLIAGLESSGDPNAISPKGALGLFGLMPDTRARFGVGNAFNIEDSTHGAEAYLKFLLKHYNNDLRSTLAAYNAGEGAVDRAKAKAATEGKDWESLLPLETQNYLKKANAGNVTVNVFDKTGGNINTQLAAFSGAGSW